MTNDDLKKLQECNTELFEGVGRILEDLGLGHLQVAGIEVEPSSINNDSNQLGFDNDAFEGMNARIVCPEGSRPVLRVNPRTGQSYYICVSDN